MSIRGARILVLGVACLAGLGACSTSTKIADLGKSGTDATATDAIATDATANDATASMAPTGDIASPPASDTTGTVVTTPAEPGPSGEPVAPLSKPGHVGDDPNDDVQLGKRYFRSNNFGLAEKSFRSAVEKHPNDAEAWVGLAAAYDRLRRFDLADRAYAEAIRLIGPTVQILNDQGFSYMLRGDYARARKKLEQAQAKDPANPYVAANLQLLRESALNGKAVQ